MVGGIKPGEGWEFLTKSGAPVSSLWVARIVSTVSVIPVLGCYEPRGVVLAVQEYRGPLPVSRAKFGVLCAVRFIERIFN